MSIKKEAVECENQPCSADISSDGMLTKGQENGFAVSSISEEVPIMVSSDEHDSQEDRKLREDEMDPIADKKYHCLR